MMLQHFTAYATPVLLGFRGNEDSVVEEGMLLCVSGLGVTLCCIIDPSTSGVMVPSMLTC